MPPPARIFCAYVMPHDSGHAPNPFYKVCTLAICTPNHRRSRRKPGDWIVGLAGAGIRQKLGAKNTWRLLYAMHVDRQVDLDSYCRDPQFVVKIPKRGASLEVSCGDDFYCKDASGRLWHTQATEEHQAKPPGTGIEKQDMGGDRVFVAEHFWYFVRNAPSLPRGQQWAERLIYKFAKVAVGLRNVYDGGAEIGGRWSDGDLRAFIDWLPDTQGVLGIPTHWPDVQDEVQRTSNCSRIQEACSSDCRERA